MEVLMGRERSQLSRALAGILTIVLAVGLVAYFHNTTKSSAADQPKVSAEVAQPVQSTATKHKKEKEVAMVTPQAPEPMVTSAPKSIDVSIAPGKPSATGAGAAALPATRPSTQPTLAARPK